MVEDVCCWNCQVFNVTAVELTVFRCCITTNGEALVTSPSIRRRNNASAHRKRCRAWKMETVGPSSWYDMNGGVKCCKIMSNLGQ